MSNILNDNYLKLKKLNFLTVLNVDEGYLKLEVPGFMPLCIERLASDVLSLMHFYVQNGDLMRDPDVVIQVFHNRQEVEVLEFQHDPYVYQRVNNDDGNADEKLKIELNNFLGFWLNNLKAQGFQYTEPVQPESGL